MAFCRRLAFAVDDVHVHAQARPEHADGVGDAFLAIHKKMLAHGMHHGVFRREIDGLGVLDDVLDVLGGDFAVGGDHGMNAAVVEAADVAATDAEIDAANLDIGHLLGLGHGDAEVFLDLGGINDLALAHTARAGLAQADDVQDAFGALLAHDDADFGSADFEAGNDVGIVKHVASGNSRV